MSKVFSFLVHAGLVTAGAAGLLFVGLVLKDSSVPHRPLAHFHDLVDCRQEADNLTATSHGDSPWGSYQFEAFHRACMIKKGYPDGK